MSRAYTQKTFAKNKKLGKTLSSQKHEHIQKEACKSHNEVQQKFSKVDIWKPALQARTANMNTCTVFFSRHLEKTTRVYS